MEQGTIFDLLYDKFQFKKQINLIELFAGYGSQNLAMRYLGVNYRHHKIVEWAVKSIYAYNDLHIRDYKDYSVGMTQQEVIDYLFDKGISMDYNQPMTLKQITQKNEEWQRRTYSSIIATNNLVDISRVHAKDLEMVQGEEYLLFYSFPCQDLSLAGLGKGMSRDDGTRSGLLWQVERILLECKDLGQLPNVLIMENVPEVCNNANAKDFQAWVKQLQDLGYSNFMQILNAKDYGIPQNRRRCFMVSILGEWSYHFPTPMKLKYRLKDFLEDNVAEKYYLSKKMIGCFMSNGTGNYPRKERFLQNLNRKDSEIGNAITTLAGQRPTDNFIIEQDNTNNKYIGTYDYTQSDTLRPTQESRVHLNNELSCTILASGNNNAIIEKKEKVIHNKKLKETLEQNDITKIENVAYIDGYNRRIINDGTTATITTGISFRNQSFVAEENKEIKRIGNYRPSGHNATSIVDPRGIAPTVMENHGQVTAIPIRNATKEGYLLAEDGDGIDISTRIETHRGTVQKGLAQTLSTKGGENVGVVVKGELKQELCDNLIEQGKVKENDVIRHNYTTSKNGDCIQGNNEIPTLDTRCDCLGIVVKDKEKVNRVFGLFDTKEQTRQAGSVYDANGLAPALDTAQGGYRQPLTLEEESVYTELEKSLFTEDGNIRRYADSNIIDKFEEGQMATTSYVNGYGHGTRVHNESVALTANSCQPSVKQNLRIRKLTPKESWRLMGVKDADTDKVQQSDSSLYHLAGDSIVSSVICGLIGELCGIDYKSKIEQLVEDIVHGNDR